MATKRRYTSEEDEIIIEAIKKNPQNLDKTFRELSNTMDRSYDSIRVHYYEKIARNQHNKLFLTLSPKKRHTNYKVFRKGMKIAPKKNNKSKWRRILDILFE